jgi:hypothetical protein
MIWNSRLAVSKRITSASKLPLPRPNRPGWALQELY